MLLRSGNSSSHFWFWFLCFPAAVIPDIVLPMQRLLSSDADGAPAESAPEAAGAGSNLLRTVAGITTASIIADSVCPSMGPCISCKCVNPWVRCLYVPASSLSLSAFFAAFQFAPYNISSTTSSAVINVSPSRDFLVV